MSVEKTDRRARYTQTVIREAFIDLYRKTPIGKITVTDICKRAEINRGTFYLHYQDAYDLLERLGESYCEKIIDHIKNALPKDGESVIGMDIARLTHGLIQSDPMLEVLVSTQPSHAAIMQRLFEGMAAVVTPHMTARYRISALEAQAVFTFLFSGFSAAYAFFMNKKLAAREAEKITAIVDAMVSDGLRRYRK